MKRNRPIGIFDSGVGGLTVYRELKRRLPEERFLYLGDTARVPYGTKSAETIVKYSLQNGQFLTTLGVKLLVVACNTASSYAMEAMVETFDVPVVGVIPSGVRKALELSRNRKIGVIATESTVASESYQDMIRQLEPASEIWAKACPLFVPLVEDGWLDHPVTAEVSRIYLEEIKGRSIDTLILGCTHYPMLKKVISAVAGPGVNLVDSAEALAGEIRQILIALGLERKPDPAQPPEDEFYVTDSVARFRKVAEIFLARSVEKVQTIDLQNLPPAG